MTTRGALRLALFDLDNTLFDHDYSRRCGLTALRRQYAQLAKVPLQYLAAEHERQLTASYDRVLAGALSPEADRLERFARFFLHFGLPMPAAEIAEAVDCYRRAYEEHRRTVPNAEPLLARLRADGVRVGVVTNGLVAVQEEKLRICRLEDCIDFLLTSEEAGVKKPDPRFFQMAMTRGGASREEAVMIGDSWNLDILGATQAGIRSLWLNRARAACPDPSLTTELAAFRPLWRVLAALYGVEDIPETGSKRKRRAIQKKCENPVLSQRF